MRKLIKPGLATAMTLLFILAACTNSGRPDDGDSPTVQDKETDSDAGTTADTRTLEPSHAEWDSPEFGLQPDDEVVVLESLKNSSEELRAQGGYAGAESGRASMSGVSGGIRARRAGPAASPRGPADRGDADKNAESPQAGGIDPSIHATEGSLFAKKGTDFVGQFPLEHTDVKAAVSGYIASTTVTQSFTNPFTEVIEAVYTFPLPGDSAINDFVMQIGERRIRGIVRPREEAERIYAEARARGHTASLMTQERPNIFTQSVANIEVGGAVDIEVTYFQSLGYEDGRYEYYFPMVVGPRYIPGDPGNEGAEEPTRGGDEPVGGQGTSPDTDRVDDASKITPPVLPEGMRSGHDISLTLEVEAGIAVDPNSLESIHHKVGVEHIGADRISVELTDEDTILNRDFVFRWGFDNDDTVGGVVTHRGDAGGFFTLMLQPELDPRDADVTPREVTFIIDVSGSMRGIPLDATREVVTRSLDTLRPDDMFNIVYFASGNDQLFETPAANTPENISKAKEFLSNVRGGGGTEMLSALDRAINMEHDERYLQMYCFFTDGYIGNEAEIHRRVKEAEEARFFAFGVGSSVNRHLIDGIGEHGRGKVHYTYPRDKEMAKRAAGTFFDMIDSPVLCDIDIDWNGLPVRDAYPGEVHDLFAGQPIQLVGCYDRPAEGTIYINGRVGANWISIPVEVSLPEVEERNECLGAIWARKRIDELESELLSDPEDKKLIQDVTDLALEFNLISKYTAFVAVDESRIVGDGTPLKVMQPVELPADVDREGIEGNIVGKPMSIDAWGVILIENEQGGVAIVKVTEGGAADNAGVQAGQLVASIDGVAVSGLMHLQGLLMQSSGGVTLGLNNAGGDARSIITVEMPQP